MFIRQLIFTVLFLSVPAALVAQVCTNLPSTYPVNSGDKLKIEERVKINGNTIAKDDYSSNPAVDSNGVVSTQPLSLPSLDAFPANNSNVNADEGDSPFSTASEVYYDEIKIDQNKTVTFNGGGIFHINKLEIKKNSVLHLGAGTYYIDEFKMEKNVQIIVDSAVVRLHIGNKMEVGDNGNINQTGTVGELLILLHTDAEFKAKKNSNIHGIIYGPDSKKIEIEENSDFKGAIFGGEEVKIKKNVDLIYTAADAAAVAATNTCPISMDHFSISHDGSAINCLPEAITITAHQSDDSVYSAYTGIVNLTTVTAHGDWSVSSATNAVNNSGNGVASYTFAAADNGQVILNLKDTFVETTNINITDGSVSESAGEDPDLSFSASGFIFNTIGTQIAGKGSNLAPGSQTIQLQAVKTSDQTGACEAALLNNVTVDLAYECMNPVNCSAGDLLSINGTPVKSNNKNAPLVYTGVTLNFGNDTQDSADIILNYADAGEIQLHASYDIPLAGGSTSGNLMTGASNLFVTRPFGFDIDFSLDRKTLGTSGVSYAAILGSGKMDFSDTAFVKAGNNFSTTISATTWEAADDLNNDGIPDSNADLSNNSVTTNFGQETTPASVDVSHTLVDPSGGSAGSLTGGNNISGFSNGSATTNLAWSEVGVIDLSANIDGNNYLGTAQDTTGIARRVGRFTPDHFDVVMTPATFDPACGNFSYLGQPFEYTSGQEAKATITAKAGNVSSNSTTQNYHDYSATDSNWWRLGDITETYTDTGSIGLDTLSVFHVPSISATTGANGSVQVTFNGPLAYDRPPGNQSPITADISLNFDVLDSDNIGYDDGSGGNTVVSAISFNGSNSFLHGRLNSTSSSGSELLPLTLPVFSEFYNGTSFVKNPQDSCSALSLANNVGLSNLQTAGGVQQIGTTTMTVGSASSTAAISSPFNNGNAGLIFSAPTAGNVGYIDVDLDINPAISGSPYWLQYNWSGVGASHSQNPAPTRATFGIYQGSSRVIQIRENWK